MSDLVERLKSYADPQYKKELLGKGSLDFVIMDILDDTVLAADRIEALEAALREIADLRYSNTSAASIAQAALAPEKVKPVMAASEKAAEVVSGWSDAKKDYASRAVPSTLAEGQDK